MIIDDEIFALRQAINELEYQYKKGSTYGVESAIEGIEAQVQKIKLRL